MLQQTPTAGGSLKRAAAVLKQEMYTLTTALRTADLKPSDWYTPGQLAVSAPTANELEAAVSAIEQTALPLCRGL